MPELADLTLVEAADAVRNGQATSMELLDSIWANLEELDPQLNATIWLDREGAEAAARAADQAVREQAWLGPLHGVPLAHKDMYYQAGKLSTCGSAIRADYRPAITATVIEKLTEAGAYTFGGLNMAEFAQNPTGHNKTFGDAHNPWNPPYITGGSSSGSGVSVAARYNYAALGSDTGGSIRGPAAWCGLVGIKPTYGRVSRRGVFPLSWTLDHCGPLSRSVEDAAITVQVLAGHDPQDCASADVPVPDYRAGLMRGVGGLRIGVPRAFFATAPAAMPAVIAGIDRTIALLRDAGATVEDVMLPDYALFSAAGRVIMMAEAFAIHQADMQNRLLDYGEITANRFVLGAAITAADYINALRARRELTDAVNAMLGRYDALLTASALNTAPRFDAAPDALSSASPMQTIPFNVTGHPAMSVPVGLADSELPISVQIVGRPFDEAMVFRIGQAIEQLSAWDTVSLPEFAA